MLFEQKERTRLEPKQQGENDFYFYDSAAGADYDQYRNTLNGWVEELPEAARNDMIGRLRADDRFGYQAALAELLIHAALKRQNYQMELHPKTEQNTNQLDFLVRNPDGTTAAYVEVTSFGPAVELFKKQKRGADIYNYLDQTKLPPGVRLGLHFVKRGMKTPSLKKLRKTVEAWAEKAVIDPASPSSRIIEIDDWQIEFFLFGGFTTDGVPKRAIAGALDTGRIVRPEIEIRQALGIKGHRYGKLDGPYLIVVADLKDELAGGENTDHALREAMFGTIVSDPVIEENGAIRAVGRRLPDGYWGALNCPQNRNVSAVILLPRPNLWMLREERWQPLRALNHFATHKLPAVLLPLRGYTTDAKGKINLFTGQPLADQIGLPAVWPPQGSESGDATQFSLQQKSIEP
jgi:hypothetical protein